MNKENEVKSNNNKIKYGQFFTVVNPFNIPVFHDWLDMFRTDKTILLEPFAGENNIVAMIKNLNVKNEWKCYDIEPLSDKKLNGYRVEQRDTIKSFPTGFTAAITNPPYLYKSSASRKGITFDSDIFTDMYQISLDVMLNNLDYVAAIIPESFITSDLFHDRLFAISSLTCRMFADTDCPVCLSLFIPTEKKKEKGLDKDDFFVYRKDKLINKHNSIKNLIDIVPQDYVNWKMNDKDGAIGIKCIDNTKGNSILFVKGDSIDKDKIKFTSRSLTRVSGLPQNINLDDFISECNSILQNFRETTSDIFLTSFKGLREDNLYRRRLDFKTARAIMNLAIERLNLQVA